MSRLLRILLLWLATLAVPIQGFAAATMLHCGPSHSGSSAAGTAQTSPVQTNGNQHVHAVEEPHGAHSDPATSDVQTAVHDDADAHDGVGTTVADLHQLSKSKCVSCSACCSATALPATPIPLDSPALAESFVTARPVSAAVFLTDGLERPPRSFLA